MTIRGISADVVVIDEASFIDQNVVYNVILPLYTVKNTALLMVSSPQDRQNFFSKILDLEVDGARICNKLDMSKEEYDRPPWLAAGKVDVARALYGNNAAMAARELDGEIGDDENAAFSTPLVHSFQNGARMELPHRFEHLFMFVDPKGFGSSHFGIMTFVMSDTTFLFVGGESHNVRDVPTKERLLRAHVDKLHAIPGFSKYGKIHLFTEANLGQESGTVAYLLRDYARVHVVHGTNQPDVPGVMTDKINKKKYYQMMSVKLTEGKVRFWTRFFSANPYLEGHSTHEARGAAVLDMLFEQTSRAIAKPTLSASGIPGLVYGAKFAADGKVQDGLEDDVFMCLNMALYHGDAYIRHVLKRSL